MTDEQIDIWLVWVQRKSGSIELREVSLTEERSEVSKDYILRNTVVYPDNPIVDIWIEKRRANHCYSSSISKEWLTFYNITRKKEE